MIYAVNATNKNEMYSFFMPITAMLWKKVIGWDSVSILIGSKDSWMKHPRTALIAEESAKFSHVHFLEGIPGLKSTSLAQICRTYASSIPFFKPDDYIVTADVDMFPLRKEWFNQIDPKKDLCIWNSQVWDNHRRFAICYIGAKASTWYEITGIKEPGLQNAIRKLLQKKKGARIDWRFDERNVTRMITSWKGWPKRTQRITRAPYTNIYRGDGPFTGKTIGNAVDSHVWRPGFREPHWLSLKQLIRVLCTDDDFKWAVDYRNRYVKLKPFGCESPDYRLKRKDIG